MLVHGLVKFVPAVARLFSLALHRSILLINDSQTLFTDPVYGHQNDIQGINNLIHLEYE